MKNLKFFLMIGFILMIACGVLMPPIPTLTAPASTAEEPLQISDPDQPIKVAPGSKFEIVIKSNPTTGYHWEIVDELNNNVVGFISKDYKADEPVLIGSGGVDIWTFKAIGAGQVTITLGSYPPSNNTAPAETLTFTIVVK